MQIQGWEISLVIAIMGVVAMFAVMKSKVNEGGTKDKEQDFRIKELEKFQNEKSPFLDHLSRFENSTLDKLETHSKKLSSSSTMKEVRDEFVTKEMFAKVEKHIDTRFDSFEKKFDNLSDGQEQILKAVSKGVA